MDGEGRCDDDDDDRLPIVLQTATCWQPRNEDGAALVGVTGIVEAGSPGDG